MMEKQLLYQLKFSWMNKKKRDDNIWRLNETRLEKKRKKKEHDEKKEKSLIKHHEPSFA